MSSSDDMRLECPLPISEYPYILLAHGGGGRLMHQLIDNIFATAFESPELEMKHDSAVLKIGRGKLVFTTDSYVVDPLFFPGGDIGSLAVNGTVNDLAMSGARPLYLSCGFIIEEGLATETLWKIALSMRRAADRADVRIVTGDTKVVDKGRGHGLFMNTSGVGLLEHRHEINPDHIRPSDQIIINGDVGRHGMAVMAEREGLSFESNIESDCAPLAGTVLRLIEAGVEIHCLRDLTRGGLATTLVEIASASGRHLQIDESLIPVREDIRGACEILGFEPIYVANEGRFVAFIPEKDKKKALDVLQHKESWGNACVIGRVTDQEDGVVTMRSVIGAERIVDMLSGEQLPRIC